LNYCEAHLCAKALRCAGTECRIKKGFHSQNESNFVPKESLVGKELREIFVCLKIIHRSKLYKTENKIIKAKKENNELISIFVKSIETAQKNL